jgi:hypothetical protein
MRFQISLKAFRPMVVLVGTIRYALAKWQTKADGPPHVLANLIDRRVGATQKLHLQAPMAV